MSDGLLVEMCLGGGELVSGIFAWGGDGSFGSIVVGAFFLSSCWVGASLFVAELEHGCLFGQVSV